MSAPIVFFDIAGPNIEKLHDFYSTVFGWKMDEKYQFTVEAISPIHAALRRDPQEKRIYIGVTDVAESLSMIETNGGVVDTPRFEVPGVVVLGLFKDPAGNEMGLVEMDGEKHKIP